MDQGWVLVILTSFITFLGCCVIYTDVIYAYLFPKRAAAKPFHIAHDTNFLICSLALSSGCLIFTSLYKLLPKSHGYFKLIPSLHRNIRLLKLTEFSCYLVGIIICSTLNIVIHLLTNESLVHCAHDGADPSHNHHQQHDIESTTHSHSHSDHGDDASFTSPASDHVHGHPPSHSKSDFSAHSHSHSHSSSESPKSASVTEVSKQYGSNHDDKYPTGSSEGSNSLSELHDGKYNPHSKQHATPAHAHNNKHPYMHHNGNTKIPKKSMSLVDLSLRTLKGETMTGKCYGDLDCCTDDILVENNLHNHHANELYFCSKPSEENALFFPDKKHMITDKSEFSLRYPNLDINSPLIGNDQTPSVRNNYSSIPVYNDQGHSHGKAHNHGEHDHLGPEYSLSHEEHGHFHNRADLNTTTNSNDSTEEDKEEEFGEHHHHIKTPLSRLLSIGLQTVMAITLHKFPEGFIMYSTSKANPELGLSIFFSMFIHNFVEGFTMTVPIYIALDSRGKALLIGGTLGSLSQPLGAAIGYYMFKGKVDMDDPFTISLIASLLAITSGFLTFISLQMFASAIGFGGKQEKVILWSFVGLLIICISNILV